MGDLHLSTENSRALKAHGLLIRSNASKKTPEVDFQLLLNSAESLFPANWLWSLADTTTPVRPISRSDDIRFGISASDHMLHAPSLEIMKLSTQFKGVVPQLNGKWGAQIYEKNQRIWLGTFAKEEEAARAYDRAAMKYRGSHGAINFNQAPCAMHANREEEAFLSKHTKEEVVDMLRRHTYEDELEAYSYKVLFDMTTEKMSNEVNGQGISDSFATKNQCSQGGAEGDGTENVHDSDMSATPEKHRNSSLTTIMQHEEHLFDKSLTPSDVGKLNRLVIPKQYAERCFPLDSSNNLGKGLILTLQDSSQKMWRFRYSYWASSQSYVFTKGWSAFVKEKKLKAGDIISFKRSLVASNIHEKRLFIICAKPSSTIQPVDEPITGAPCSTSAGGSARKMSMHQVHTHDTTDASLATQTRKEAPFRASACNTDPGTSLISHSSMNQLHARDISTHAHTADAHSTVMHQKNTHQHTHTNVFNMSEKYHKSMHQSYPYPSSTPSPYRKRRLEQPNVISSTTNNKINVQQLHKHQFTMSQLHMNQRGAMDSSMLYAKSTINQELFLQSSVAHSDQDHVHSNHEMSLKSFSCLTQQCIEEDQTNCCTARHEDSTASSSSTRAGGLRLFGVDMELDILSSVGGKGGLRHEPVATNGACVDETTGTLHPSKVITVVSKGI